jgi:hypothetical protein
MIKGAAFTPKKIPSEGALLASVGSGKFAFENLTD